MSRYFKICLLVAFSISFTSLAQKGKKEPLKHEQEVRDMVAFFQYMLNTLGDEATSARDKDVLVTESFTKVFRDSKVQVQDDLDEDRAVITNKDVTAYLKDVDFFFKDVEFDFNIENIESKQTDNDKVFYKVTSTRNLKGITSDGKKVNNTSPRFIEINFDPKDQDLKIVSVYTREFDEKKALLNWWSSLSYEWQEIFKYMVGSDSIGLTQIKQISTIDSLDISNNRYIVSIDPVAQLLDLRYLNISNTNITDLNPIRNLTEIVDLNIADSKVNDIAALRYALNLSRLNMNNCDVRDITVFEKLTNLQSLEMQGIQANDFMPLQHLQQLQFLNLKGSGLTDIAPIGTLTSLTSLNVAETPLQTISLLGNLKQLTSLNLDSTRVTDFAPLASVQSLAIVSLNATAITELEPLAELPRLEKIYCDQSGIKKAEAEAFMAARPQVLVIYDSHDLRSWWQDLTPVWKDVLRRSSGVQLSPTNEELAKVTNLDSINLANYVSVKTLDPLKRLSKLSAVVATNTGIRDIAVLRNHLQLRYLDISGTQVADVSPLTSSSLQVLKADKSKIQQIDTLSSLPSLNRIYADNTGLTLTAVSAFLDKNPDCLVVFQTAELEQWWTGLTEDWRQIFRTQISINGKLTREKLHELVMQPKLQFHDIQVHELTAIQPFFRLRDLDFSGTSVQNISHLAQLDGLKSLSIHDNPINDLGPLRAIKTLETLDISNTPVDDLSPISSLDQLKNLNCAGTQIKKLSQLQSLRALTILDCSNTDVRSLSPVNGLPLVTLKCYNTRISKGKVKKYRKEHPECNVIHY